MRGGGSDFPLSAHSQPGVYFFEGSEESGEGILKGSRTLAGLAEIAVAELVGRGDYRGAHRAIFVGSLRPGESVFVVNPQAESHEPL